MKKKISWLIKKILFFLDNLKERLFPRLNDSEIKMLKKSSLLKKLEEKSFSNIINSVHIVHYPSDDLIFKEGEVGHFLYFILKGSVRIFTITALGKKIALARLDAGNFFGEQALHDHVNNTRNASVEAITDVSVVKIPKKLFSQLLKKDQELEAELKAIGKHQVVHKLMATINFYKNFKFLFQNDIKYEILSYDKDSIIFKEGDNADFAYFIIDGKVIIKIADHQPPIDQELHSGHLFGELGVIHDAPRQGTCIAAEPVRLIQIPAEDFKRVYRQNTTLQELLKSLGKTYSLSRRGIAQQFLGTMSGKDIITTEYKLNDGRTVVASNAIHDNYFVMEQNHIEKSVPYRNVNHSYQVELRVLSHNIVGITCSGVWEDLPKACDALLDKMYVSSDIIDKFRQTGKFNLATASTSSQFSVVCDCLSIEKSTVNKLLNQGVKSLSEISIMTSACTVCGICRSRILDMLGQNTWISAIMTKVKEHSPTIRSYELKPSFGNFKNFLPGDYIVLQIRIEDNWVERSYMISDVMNNGKIQITIQKKSKGFFTQWLFDQAPSQIPIYVSQQKGAFNLNVNAKIPILCIGVELGITPFFTFAKAINQHNTHTNVHIFYVVKDKNDFLFLNEFKQIIQQQPTISLTLWDTKTKGPLSKDQLEKSVNNLMNPNIYICGPEGFETKIMEDLHSLYYSDDEIFVEKFTYANPLYSLEEAF